MKKKTKEPFIPVERHETIRQKIISLLEAKTFSSKEISVEVVFLRKKFMGTLNISRGQSIKENIILLLHLLYVKNVALYSEREIGLKSQVNVLCAVMR